MPTTEGGHSKLGQRAKGRALGVDLGDVGVRDMSHFQSVHLPIHLPVHHHLTAVFNFWHRLVASAGGLVR